jgi:two-component system cell cycle sensor histidine kinase PleC
VAGRIARGELDVDVPPAGPDETGNLLAAMRVMQLNLRAMMQREIAQRQSAQARLVDAIESSPEAIVLVDAADRILLANTTATLWFAAVGDHLRAGAGFAAFLAHARAMGAFAYTYEQAAQAGDPHDAPIAAIGEGRLADGRWLRVSRGSTRDGGTIVFWSDVTNLKDRERDLIRARDQARAANAAKTSFLATMSHELRTPLNAIIGFSEMIHRELLGPVGKPEYRAYAGDVEHSGRRLLAVINDILDIAKSESGQLELRIEAMSLGEVFEGCRRQVEEQCARQGLRLEFQPPPSDVAIQADADKVRQILMNLASNAVKFTPEGGMVSVMGCFRPDGDAEIVVSDTGIGMRQEDIPVALSAFEQIDGRLERKYEGTGLGLPLTRALVELHGGRMQIASAPDAGTMVTVRLPAQGPMAEAAGTPAQQSAAA